MMKPYYQSDSATVYCADVLEALREMPDESVHCCVTSPPYWNLRSYLPDDHADKGREVGLEQTVQEYVEKLVTVFREVRRVLRSDGTLWLVLGDSFASGKGSCRNPGGGENSLGKHKKLAGAYPLDRHNLSHVREMGLKPKDLIGVPWLVAFALRADNWWLRSDIVWAKSAPMPESVQDRPTRAHEYIFLLTKAARYFYDSEAIREPLADSSLKRIAQPTFNEQTGGVKDYGKKSNRSTRKTLENFADKQRGHGRRHAGFNDRWDQMTKVEQQAGGANKRDVWMVGPEPFPGEHYAVMPQKIVEPCVKAGTSEKGCCSECGAPWKRRIEKGPPPPEPSQRNPQKRLEPGQAGNVGAGNMGFRASKLSGQEMNAWKAENPDLHIGWEPTCKCEADAVPCTVCDPFGGSMTTGVVALKLGRHFVGIELSQEYLDGFGLDRLRAAETGLTAREVRAGQQALFNGGETK